MNKTLYYLLFVVLVSGLLFTSCNKTPKSSSVTEETVQEIDLQNAVDEEKGGEYPPVDETTTDPSSEDEAIPQTNYQSQPNTIPQTETQKPSAAATIYANGTYNTDGTYVSPAGSDNISVIFTLDNDVITGVSVRPNASNQTSRYYQEQFAAGVAAVIIGQKVDEVSVGKINGSSLTTNGFNAALNTMKGQAAK